MGYGNDETYIKEPKIYFRGMKNYGKDICRMKKERIIAAAAAVTLMSGTISPGVFASNTESTRISDTSWSIPDSVAGKISYSNSYNPAKWQDYWSNGDESWRDGLVTGNGENGLLEDCAPEEDVMIFQNVKFNYPSGAQRETPELESVMDDARQSLLNDTKSASSAEAVDILLNRAAEWSEDNGLRSGSWKIQNTYAFHPGMQLRLKMNGLNNGDETNYYRYTYNRLRQG